jgi:hypothetical protein
MMFIDFKDFVSAPEETTRSVLKFVGADVSSPHYAFTTVPPGMQVSCCQAVHAGMSTCLVA